MSEDLLKIGFFQTWLGQKADFGSVGISIYNFLVQRRALDKGMQIAILSVYAGMLLTIDHQTQFSICIPNLSGGNWMHIYIYYIFLELNGYSHSLNMEHLFIFAWYILFHIKLSLLTTDFLQTILKSCIDGC